MVTAEAQHYPLGGTQTERDRLLAQARQYEPAASAFLDRLSIKPGSRAIDIGCGPIGILDLLSQRVGPSGAVVGLEREARFADERRTRDLGDLGRSDTGRCRVASSQNHRQATNPDIH